MYILFRTHHHPVSHKKMVNASTVATLTGVTLVTGVLGYAVYFDYKRRNDPAFRARLRKQVKRTQRELKRRDEMREHEANQFIKQTVEEFGRPGALPDGLDREQTFSQQVQVGEVLQAQGQEHYLQAAAAFYKALKVYPAPGELLLIYRQAVNADVLDYVHRMVAQDSALSGEGRDPLAALSRAANLSDQVGGRLEEVDDEAPTAASSAAFAPAAASNDNAETAAPSVSSQEWEKVTDDDAQAAAAPAAQDSAANVGQQASDAATATLSETAPAQAPTS